MVRVLPPIVLGFALIGRDSPDRDAGGKLRAPLARVTAVRDVTAQARPIGIQHATVIDVENNRRLRDQTVIIEGARIATVGPSDQVRIPDGYGVVDGRGKFIVPGFVDARPFARDSSGAIDAAAARRRLERTVLIGVTTVVLTRADSAALQPVGDVLMPRVQVVDAYRGAQAATEPAAAVPPNEPTIVETLRLLVNGGASPGEAIRVTTFEIARVNGWHHRGGSVAPNRYADLLILSANPLDDVNNVALIDAMVVGGRFVDANERNARIARLPRR